MTPMAPVVPWVVSIVLVEAAVIDGLKLRVPNWLTFHLVLAGLAYAAWAGGFQGLLWSLGARRSAWACSCRCMPSAGWERAT